MFAGGTEGVPDQVLIVTALQRTGALRQTLQLWLLLLPWYSWPDTPAHLHFTFALWWRWWWWGGWEVPPCYPGHPSALQFCDPRSKTPGKWGETVHVIYVANNSHKKDIWRHICSLSIKESRDNKCWGCKSLKSFGFWIPIIYFLILLIDF